MGARQLDLLRKWTICADPDDLGLGQRWWERPPADGWVSCRADQAWQLALGDGFRGVAWYRRRARLPAKWLGNRLRVRLRFGAVATECRVWVNGLPIGSHTGDYVPFEFDITDALAGEEHCEIVCRVDQIVGEPPEVPGEQPWGGHITRGFHDVLGLQHSGIWGGVNVRVTGPLAFLPNGLAAHADPETGAIRVVAELSPHESEGALHVTIREPGTGTEHTTRVPITPGQTRAVTEMHCDVVHPWSPESPQLGEVRAMLRTRGVPARDELDAPVAFRDVTTGGRDNRQILLNGTPLLVRGVLDWGVEPRHVAPSPTADEIRERFIALRERGFNCVCLCMVYPPDEFYRIADETGMLLWQIHPVWKSPMDEELLPEYRRLYAEFLRRDRRHPSVVIISATCEHERFAQPLAEWWWKTAKRETPAALHQVQTGFLRWSDTDRTDLLDEHTYDNTGRWLCYLDDMGSFLGENPARPFVMGETIIGTSWPDTRVLLDKLGEERPWWAPKGLDGFAEFEREVARRFGEETVSRMREQGDTFSLTQRKTQSEAFRSHPHNAGWVMNHLRDVANCQCGFEDDLGRWRFSPEQLRAFLDERILLFRAPGGAVGLAAGEPIRAEIGLSHFGAQPTEAVVRLGGWMQSSAAIVNLQVQESTFRVEPGEVRFAPVTLDGADPGHPAQLHLRAEAEGFAPNEWRLRVFPKHHDTPTGVCRDDTTPYTPEEREPDFAEKRYSDGWALECKSWKPRLPDLSTLLPAAPHWSDAENTPRVDHLTIVTTRLTERTLLHLERGGRVVLLASKAAGSPPTRWVNLYGQVPLIIEQGEKSPHTMLGEGESAWVLDTLGLDLNRWSCRAVPSHALDIADSVEPIVRLVFTHDKGRPEVWDQVFTARVGLGLLAVTTLDHDNPAGRYLLHRLIEHVHRADAPQHERGTLEPELIRTWSWPA